MAAAAAAFTVMGDEEIKVAKDFSTVERVERITVGSEVVAEIQLTLGELAAVEVTLGELEVLMKIPLSGGGGSFNSGTNQENECCYNTAGNGKVTITFIE